MAMDTLQEWMSAISPTLPWRGPMVDVTVEESFNTYAAELNLFSGVFEAASGGSSSPIGFFPHTFFANRYFPDRYFPGTGETASHILACAHAADVALYDAIVEDAELYTAVVTSELC